MPPANKDDALAFAAVIRQVKEDLANSSALLAQGVSSVAHGLMSLDDHTGEEHGGLTTQEVHAGRGNQCLQRGRPLVLTRL